MSLAPGTLRGAPATRLAAVVAVLLALVFLRMARTVVLPLVAGLVLAALVAPIASGLSRWMPRGVALLATVLLVTAAVLGLSGALAWSAKHVGERMQHRRDRLEQVHAQASRQAARVGIRLPGFPTVGSDAQATPPRARAPESSAADSVTSPDEGRSRSPVSRLLSGISGVALAIGFMALALAEIRDARDKVRRRFSLQTASRIIDITVEVATHLRRYFVVKSITSAITGAATLLVTLAFGMDFWYLWGALAFLLEYVPTVGSILAVIPPALYAAIQFEGLVKPLTLAGTLTVVQLVLGNYVDPKIEGRLLALSPLVVLFSVVFWAWIWGPAGSLLGVPMTVAITTVARHFDGSRWLWAMLTEPERREAGKEG